MEKLPLRSQEDMEECRKKMLEINGRFMEEFNSLLGEKNLSALAVVDLLLTDCKAIVNLHAFEKAGIAMKDVPKIRHISLS